MRAARLRLGVAGVLLFGLGSCHRAPRNDPAVKDPAPVTTLRAPLPGPAATGRSGDWLLTRGRVQMVVGALDHREGFSATGGNLLDISVDGGPDALDGLSTWFERVFPRQAAYDRAVIEGSALRLRGHDSADPSIAAETLYELLPSSPDGVLASLRITTTLTATDPRADYDLGDIIGWGGLRHFAPGPGFALRGDKGALPWIGGQGEDYALLLVSDGPISGPHGSSWSDPVYREVSLPAGQPVSYQRTLHVGRTLAEMLAATGAQRSVELRVRERGTGAAIAEASFELSQGGRPYAVGRVDEAGRIALRLPAGELAVTVQERGRNGETTSIPADLTSLDAWASAPGHIEARVTGPDGVIAARLRFWGRDGTADPVLGPDHFAVGGDRANLAGPSRLLIPPGSYRVVASHGPSWSLAEAEVVVPEGGSAELALALHRLVDVSGFLQCDLHQHAVYSADSAVPAVDGIVASAAEGLDCIATTEHDAVAEWAQHVADADLPGPMLWLPGLEVTTNTDGHYNVYPHPPSRGPIGHDGLDPTGIAAAIRAASPNAVLQLNHPRFGEIGVFNRLGDLDAIAALDHDVVEVLNGKHTDDAEEVLDDVARLLGRGVVRGLVGASDSHRLVGQERGSARTYVPRRAEPELSPEGVGGTIRAGRTIASNGPLLQLTAEGSSLSITLAAPAWMPVTRVALYGGPLGEPRAALGQPLATWEITTDGERRALSARAAGRSGWWYLAVARGEQTMEPWLDAKPWAATSPQVVGE